MRISYELNWIWNRINVPIVFPWFKITKIEPEVREVQVEIPVPTPEPTQMPISPGRPESKENQENNYPSIRTYDLGKGHFRLSGHMAGTEKFRLHHAREALIKFFVDTNNKALRSQDIRKHPDTPFWHNFVKCEPDCKHRVISHGVLHSVLYNRKYKTEDLQEMFGTTKLFISVELPFPHVKPVGESEHGRGPAYTGTINGYRLSDEMYFNELNKLGLSDYLQEEPEELTKVLDEEINIPKQDIPGWRKEAMDRMT